MTFRSLALKGKIWNDEGKIVWEWGLGMQLEKSQMKDSRMGIYSLSVLGKQETVDWKEHSTKDNLDWEIKGIKRIRKESVTKENFERGKQYRLGLKTLK